MRMLVPFSHDWSNRSLSPWQRGDLFADFNQLFDSFTRPTQQSRAINYEVEETDDKFLLSFDMPGVKKGDIKIEVEGNQLRVSGERRSEAKDGETETRSLAQYQRSFSLPSTVNGEKIEAQYEDGVLSIALPKAELAKARRIEIQSRS